MTAQNFGPCQIHIPHKDWARDIQGVDEQAARQDRENWSEVERFINERLPGCGPSCYVAYGTGAQVTVSATPVTVTPALSTTCGALGSLAREVIVCVTFPSSAVGYRHMQINVPTYSPVPTPSGMTVPGVARAAGQMLNASAFIASNLTYTFTLEQTSGGNLTVAWTVYEMGDCACVVPTGC